MPVVVPVPSGTRSDAGPGGAPEAAGEALPAAAAAAGVGSSARNGPIGLAGHRDRPEHGGQPAPVAVLHPRPRHAIASGHRAAALLQPGTLIQMPLQQQPILLPRVDLQPGFQLTVPGTHRLRPVQPLHHRFQIPPDRAGPPRPTVGVLGALAGRAVGRADTQVQTGEDDITGSWFKIVASQPVDLPGALPRHGTNAPITPNPAKPDP